MYSFGWKFYFQACQGNLAHTWYWSVALSYINVNPRLKKVKMDPNLCLPYTFKMYPHPNFLHSLLSAYVISNQFTHWFFVLEAGWSVWLWRKCNDDIIRSRTHQLPYSMTRWTFNILSGNLSQVRYTLPCACHQRRTVCHHMTVRSCSVSQCMRMVPSPSWRHLSVWVREDHLCI